MLGLCAVANIVGDGWLLRAFAGDAKNVEFIMLGDGRVTLKGRE